MIILDRAHSGKFGLTVTMMVAASRSSSFKLCLHDYLTIEWFLLSRRMQAYFLQASFARDTRGYSDLAPRTQQRAGRNKMDEISSLARSFVCFDGAKMFILRLVSGARGHYSASGLLLLAGVSSGGDVSAAGKAPKPSRAPERTR